MLYSSACLDSHLRECGEKNRELFLLMQKHLREYINNDAGSLIKYTVIDIISHLEGTPSGNALLNYTLQRAESREGKTHDAKDIVFGLISSLVAAVDIGNGSYILGANPNVRSLSIKLADALENFSKNVSSAHEWVCVPVIRNIDVIKPEEDA